MDFNHVGGRQLGVTPLKTNSQFNEVKHIRPYSADAMLIDHYEIFSNSQVNAEIPKVQNETPSGSSL